MISQNHSSSITNFTGKNNLGVPLSLFEVDGPEHTRRRRDFIVYPIIPRREITLIGGSPRVGTTTLLTMICDDYRNGRPVLGFPSYSSDDSHGMLCFTHTKGVVHRIAAKMGVVTGDLNLSVMGIKQGERDKDNNTFRRIVEKMKDENPDLQVIFLDGYHRLFRGNRKDYDTGADATDSVQEVLEDVDLTLVAVGRSTKLSADNAETAPMERFYGSVSATERIATFISMERLDGKGRENPKRTVTIDTQERPVIQNWEFTNDGLLVPESQAMAENRIGRETFEEFELLVMARGEGGEVDSEELNEIGVSLGVSKATVARYRNRLIETEKLAGRYGMYVVVGES